MNLTLLFHFLRAKLYIDANNVTETTQKAINFPGRFFIFIHLFIFFCLLSQNDAISCLSRPSVFNSSQGNPEINCFLL